MDLSITFEFLLKTFQGTFDKKRLGFLSWASDRLNLDLGKVLLVRDICRDNDAQDEQLLVLLLLLADAANNGSLCLDLTSSEMKRKAATMGFYQLPDWVRSQNFSQLTINQQQPLAIRGDLLYWHKYDYHEQLMDLSIRQLMSRQNQHVLAQNANDKNISSVLDVVIASMSFALETKQIQAIICALLQPFSFVSGGPGTGKTTIMTAILRCLCRLGYDSKEIALAAPTGRAAYRMTESLRNGIHELTEHNAVDEALAHCEALTIHRLIGVSINRQQSDYHSSNPLPHKIIVVDEVSMVDIMLMNQLLQALSHDCRIILLGDQFQLPSVESGAILADLMPPVENKNQFTAQFKQRVIEALPSIQDKFPSTIREGLIKEMDITDSKQLMGDCVTVLDVSQRCQQDIAQFSEWVKVGEYKQAINMSGLQHISRQALMADDKSRFDFSDQAGIHYLSADGLNTTDWQAIYYQWISDQLLNLNVKNYADVLHDLRQFNHDAIEHSSDLLQQLFTFTRSQRILTVVRKGPYGSDQINQHICEHLKKTWKLQGLGS